MCVNILYIHILFTYIVCISVCIPIYICICCCSVSWRSRMLYSLLSHARLSHALLSHSLLSHALLWHALLSALACSMLYSCMPCYACSLLSHALRVRHYHPIRLKHLCIHTYDIYIYTYVYIHICICIYMYIMPSRMLYKFATAPPRSHSILVHILYMMYNIMHYMCVQYVILCIIHMHTYIHSKRL